MTIIHDALDLIVQSPIPVPLLMTSGSQDWTPFRSCSLDNLTVQAKTGADISWLATEASAVGKRVIRILLECFLVCFLLFAASYKIILFNNPDVSYVIFLNVNSVVILLLSSFFVLH